MTRELEHLPDWEHMMHFAIELIIQSKQYAGAGIWGERIAILHLDHANELLMKSFLIKKGFIINYLDKDEINKGVKKEEVLDKDKTMDYKACLGLACKEIGGDSVFNKAKQEKILNFHKIRNEIQHRAVNIRQNKKSEIEIFYPCFRELYSLMFSDIAGDFPEFVF